MKRGLFFLLFLLFFTEQAQAITLGGCAQSEKVNGQCPVIFNYIQIGPYTDKDASLDYKSINLGPILTKETKIRWSTKISKNFSYNYNVLYACQATPDIGEATGNVLTKSITTETTFKIPYNPKNCYCKIWVIAKNSKTNAILGSANSRPFQICARLPEATLPQGETLQLKYSKTKKEGIFSGKILSLGGASSAEAIFQVGYRDVLLSDPNQRFFISEPLKKWLVGGVSVKYNDISEFREGYCYRMWIKNEAGGESAGTRCLRNDNYLIRYPKADSKVEVNKVWIGQDNETYYFDVTVHVQRGGNSPKDYLRIFSKDFPNDIQNYTGKGLQDNQGYSFILRSKSKILCYKFIIGNEDGRQEHEMCLPSGEMVETLEAESSNIGENRAFVYGKVLDRKNVKTVWIEWKRKDGMAGRPGMCEEGKSTEINISEVDSGGAFTVIELQKKCLLPNTAYAFRAYARTNDNLVVPAVQTKYFTTKTGSPLIELENITSEIDKIAYKAKMQINAKLSYDGENNKIKLWLLIFRARVEGAYSPTCDLEYNQQKQKEDKTFTIFYDDKSPWDTSKNSIVSSLSDLELDTTYCIQIRAQRMEEESDVAMFPSIGKYYTHRVTNVEPLVKTLPVNDSDRGMGGVLGRGQLIYTGTRNKYATPGFYIRYEEANGFENMQYSYIKAVPSSVEQSASDPNSKKGFFTAVIPFNASKYQKLCFAATVKNDYGQESLAPATEICIDKMTKPLIVLDKVTPMGSRGDIKIEGTLESKGGLNEPKLQFFVQNDPTEKSSECSYGGEGKVFEIPTKNFTDKFVKTINLADKLGCKMQIWAKISMPNIKGTDPLYNESYSFSKKMAINIGLAGIKLPLEFKQEARNLNEICPGMAMSGCGATAQVDVLYYWYMNHPKIKETINKVMGVTSMDGSTMLKFKNKYFGYCCNGSLNISVIGTTESGLGKYVQLSHYPNGEYVATSNRVRRSEILDELYDKALSKGYPVIMRCLRITGNMSQHYIVLTGLEYTQGEGKPSDNDRIYIAETTMWHDNTFIGQSGYFGTKYWTRKQLLDKECITSEQEPGWSDGGFRIGAWWSPYN